MKYLNLEEELLTFETAKLAREKGFFNGSYNTFIEYLKNTLKQGYTNEDVSPDKIIPKGTIIEHSYNTEEDGAYSNKTIYKEIIEYENPTQSILQKWLREKHNIYVIITEEFYIDGINHNIQILTYDSSNVENNYINNDKSTKIYGDNGEFKTYEKALEFGLQKALKLIENDNN